MSAGGGLFVFTLLNEGIIMPTVAAGVVTLAGFGVLIGGVGANLTRDRLELDGVTKRGVWTRHLLGWSIRKPIDFDFDHARHVTITHFTESAPDSDGPGTTNVRKVRARLLISSPRRAIVLIEAERQNTARVRAVAQATADILGLELELPPEPDD